MILPNHDLGAQLNLRKDRLSWLIHFINGNGVLGKMSQRSRQQLATDAEQLFACHQLWLSHNLHLEYETFEVAVKYSADAMMQIWCP